MSILWSLSFTNTPLTAPTLGIIRTDTSAVVVASGTPYTGSGTSWTYTQTGEITGVEYQLTWNATAANGDPVSGSYTKTAVLGSAAGEIIDQQDIVDFLGTVSLEILSQQNSDLLTIDAANVQRAIDKAEDRAKSVLANAFAVPLTVATIALAIATSPVLGRSEIIVAICQYAAFWLNKWRAVQGLSGEGRVSQAAIDNLAAAWEADADRTLRAMVRWAQGYTDGLAVDLDMLSTSPRASTLGAEAPVFFNANDCRRPPIGCW